MRIVAGTLRGRRLEAPAGTGTRPTADRVREAVFSMVGPLDGAAVLDPFAGTGAMALEALSRGAATAVCADTAPEAVAAIRANARMLDDPARLRIRRADWRSAVRAEAAAGRTYDLCILDPPYGEWGRLAGELGAALAPVLAPGATVVIEGPAGGLPAELPGLEVASRRDRTYGATGIGIIRLGGMRT